MWLKVVIAFLVAITILFSAVVLIGEEWYEARAQDLFGKIIDASSQVKTSAKVDFKNLAGLPQPVQKYFRNVLVDGQRFIRYAKIEQVGELQVDPDVEKWSPFKAKQVVTHNPMAFLWDAKVNLTPLLHVRVRDSLVNGHGAGKVFLMSVIPVGNESDNPELNSGSLYRYLAEAVWHPTSLLPQAGVRWETIDNLRALARLEKNGIKVALEFRFNNNGEITGLYTEDRFGKFGDSYVLHPWEGRFSNYQDFDGVKIPTEGEVGWHLPKGWWLFWKGKISKAEFVFE
jgi:hypothetical protein